ncbi:MAG: 7-cyano-7-deazaguanine synthase QueC [Candidatus Omnitrophica bacterium]|nr:7-cyano-7-deazaguanine synthase QueC [Candidatus Omnitrophota bacterium]
MDKKAIVLLSGGLDSAVTLYMARRDYTPRALIFDYGQKALKELESAKRICDEAQVEYVLLKIDMPWKGSSLLDFSREVPSAGSGEETIPDTYVPARNIIFLSYGVSFAEASGSEAVFIGAHQLDYSNYPDCRGEFFDSFRQVLAKGTKSGQENSPVKIITPVLNKTKKEIVHAGHALNVPFEHTWSCYRQGDIPCGECESCVFRIKAFEQAGLSDPLMVKK